MYKDVIVKKPWGYEYLCYQNEILAIWLLHIKHNMSTSLHCHPNKHTGLVVLNGTCEVSFLRGNVIMNSLDKINIFRSRFHSTRSLSNGGSFILEFETPEDKQDLVRLEDSYGREDKEYEGRQYEVLKDKSCFWINEPGDSGSVSFKDTCISHFTPNSKEELFGFPKDEFFVSSRGGIVAHNGSQILWPADIIDGVSLERLLKRFDLNPGTTFMHIKRLSND